jgi:Acetyltransferase (GNAT) domain
VKTAGTTYRLEPVELEPAAWNDCVRKFASATIFHSAEWLAMLKETTGGEPVRLRIVDGLDIKGFFCGLIVRKGPFRFLGSPLPGWGTPAMGPIYNPHDFDLKPFVDALDSYCETRGIHVLETTSPSLDAEDLSERGFQAVDDVTYSIDLSTGEASWKNITPRKRNYVRQAERAGVTVEQATESSVVDEHYQQLKEVFAKWLSRPPYGIERPRAIWNFMCADQKLFLRALHEQRCIATYILVRDEHTMWGLATASTRDDLNYHPNELIHCRAIEKACELGLQRFDLCGGGDYKRNYGATSRTRRRWIKGYSTLAMSVYRAAEKLWWLRRSLIVELALLKRRFRSRP